MMIILDNIIFTHSNLTDFKDEINIVIEKISKWFQANSLILNFNKANYIQFMAKPKLAVDIRSSYKANLINNTYSTNFLGLNLDSTLSWKTHIDQLSSKLNSACYIIRSLRSIISTKKLRTIYHRLVFLCSVENILVSLHVLQELVTVCLPLLALPTSAHHLSLS